MDVKLPGIDLAMQRRLRQKLGRAQKADHYYFIDVVGTCNLRCPSCPVGNVASEAPKGFMSLDHLRQVLGKIAADQGPGKRLFVDLYNWGEPTLHPDLAACVRLVHEFGFGCGISSNMNVFPNMRDVVKAQPDYIRVSLSGFSNANYRLTHRGGDINAVKGNMHLLRHYLDRYRSDTVVQVGFHVYRTNFPDDFLKMRTLCDDLGFIFAPVIATMMPAEKAVEAVDGHIERDDAAIHERFVIPLTGWRDHYRQDGIALPDCQFRQARTTINYDGSVSLCCAVYQPDKTIAPDFLALDSDALARAKYSHAFCETCMSRSMHQMFTGVPSPSLTTEATRVLGPLYRAFLDQERQIDDPDMIVVDGNFVRVQEVYDRAMGLLRTGELAQAEAYCVALVEQAPAFGEGFFHAARLAEHRGERQEAIRLMSAAVRLVPEHAPYVEDLQRLQSTDYRKPDFFRYHDAETRAWIETVYERGIAALKKGNRGLAEAEQCFDDLVQRIPDHAEGCFQAARIAKRRGNHERALSLMANAVRLSPDHALYRQELDELKGDQRTPA